MVWAESDRTLSSVILELNISYIEWRLVYLGWLVKCLLNSLEHVLVWLIQSNILRILNLDIVNVSMVVVIYLTLNWSADEIVLDHFTRWDLADGIPLFDVCWIRLESQLDFL